ncbi:(R)-stereoselective amidase [Pararobbsia alpina]|uniref:carbon-nitrogen hydrolase family protein n=1 Tax=Pararobbsia alpina TaxID=621374 RepID=UPI0039A74FC3
MQIELAQLALIDGDVATNTERVLDAISRANVAGGTQMIVFPETTLTGFPTRDNVAALAEPLDGPSVTRVRNAARAKGVAVVLGLAEREGGRFYNTTVLIDAQGDILLNYRKTHLWASDVGVFTPGDRYATCVWNGLTVGMLICYDIEFPETARALAQIGADLLLVTNGNMDPFGAVHRRAIVARAMENQVFAVLVNRCGTGDDNLVFAGESAVIDPSGDVLAETGRDPAVFTARLDRTKLETAREHYRYLHDARIGLGLTTLDDDGSGVRTVVIDGASSDARTRTASRQVA